MDRSKLNSFYVENTGLIHTVARKGYGRLQSLGSGLDYEDLFQALSVVFVKSYDKFDEESGNRFSTYFMRAAYNAINKIAEEFEIERIENGTRSIEEMSEWLGDEGEGDITEVIPCPAATPAEVVETTSTIKAMFSSMSPLAATIAEMTINPPDFIEREFVAAQAFAEHARSIGIERRASKSLNLAFVCSVLEKTSGMPVATIREARKEIVEVVERSVK